MKLIAALSLTLLLSVSSYGQRSADSSDSLHVESAFSLEYPKLVGRDVVHTFTFPARWNGRQWLEFSLKTVAVVGTAGLLDKSVRNFAQDNRSDASNWVADRFNRFGSSYPSFAFLGFYAVGLAFNKPTAKMVALDGFSASLIADVMIAPALKYSLGRHRPYYNEGPYKFSLFSHYDSFPSGHSTRAFTTATVVASHYRQFWMKTVAYGIATMVAFARVNYDVHFASDVLAGAFIGVAVGEMVVHFNLSARTDHSQH
jgi:hypothetical protein